MGGSMPAPGSPPVNGFPGFGAGGYPFRVDIEPATLINTIVNNGYEVLWEKSAPCPNRLGEDIDRHDNNCPYCHKGRVYFDPQAIKILISGINMMENYFIGGKWDSGNARITTLAENRLSYWDRLTVRNATVRFYELVRRNKNNNVDTLKYQAIRIEKAFGIGATGLVDLGEGRDFTLNGREVHWNKNRIAPGSFYSVVYDRVPVYIVLDLINWIRQRPIMVKGKVQIVGLPLSAVAKLEFLVEDDSTGSSKSDERVPDRNEDFL